MKSTFLKIACVVVFFLNTLIINAQDSTEVITKKFHHDFTTAANSLLKIENKFGKLVVENWDKSEVSIDVTIEVKTKDQKKADKVFEVIEILFEAKDTLLSAVTKINKSVNNADLSINYKVKMPKSLRTEFFQKYGDVFIDELSGKTNITVKYGNLKINLLSDSDQKPVSEIDLGYSKAEIKKCNWLKVSLKYSDLEIEEGAALMIDAKYSKLEIVKCRSIVAECEFCDKFEVGETNNFVCNGEYSSFKIGKLNSKLELDIQFSSAKIKELSAEFKEISIESEYSSVKVAIPESVSYNLDAKSSFGKIKYSGGTCDGAAKLCVGKEKNPSVNVKVSTKFGNIDLD